MRALMMQSAAAALLALAPLGHAETAQQTTDPRGRYEGVAASDTAVWVIDTHSGRVRKCTQEFADQVPVCTPLSN